MEGGTVDTALAWIFFEDVWCPLLDFEQAAVLVWVWGTRKLLAKRVDPKARRP